MVKNIQSPRRERELSALQKGISKLESLEKISKKVLGAYAFIAYGAESAFFTLHSAYKRRYEEIKYKN